MRRSRLAAALLGAALALGAAAPGRASVTYEVETFEDTFLGPLTGHMTYVSPDFIATSRLVPRDGLDRCELPLDLHLCDMVRFDPLTVIGDTLAFNFDAGPPALFAVFAFQPGAFGAPGVYDSTAGNFGDARLTVTRSAAPEPGQWTILITGLTLAGTALRRRRIGRPARWAPKVRV